ncbi:MAG: TCP-1/cpn60 chaperonin family protein, partial [Chloroflexota bacterium]
MKASQKPGVVFQPQVQRRLQRGIQTMVSAIVPTLGPLSGGVAIDHINKSVTLPEFLDDGGVIARRIIQLPNRDEDMGAMLVRSMVLRQSERVGDGIATAAVLLEAIFNAGVRYLASGGNSMQLRRHLESALPLILNELDRMVFRLEGQTALTDMARTLCHEDEMAALLGEAFDLVGEYGRLEIREDYGRGLRRDYVEGSYYHTGTFSRAFFSPPLLPGEIESKITLENAAIFLCDFEIEDHKALFPVMQTAHAAGIKALVIVARSLSDKAVSLLVANNKMDKFKAIAVRLPGLNPTDRMDALDDLSKLTGAKPFIQVAGQSLENVSAADFGRARRLWTDMKAFGIVGGAGDPVKLRQHLRNLKAVYHNTNDTDVRKRTQARIATLMGSSVTLWIGGFTKTEINARKSLAERAALTMRAALEEGVLPGGGIALLNCRQVLEKRLLCASESDERAAYRILIEALSAPASTLYRNAG